MKKDIHPKYGITNVTCSCGNTFETKSTIPEIHVDICSVCHPFYTGKQKLVDTAGRVDKFRSRLLKMEKIKTNNQKSSKTSKIKNDSPDSLENISDIKKELIADTVDLKPKNNK